MSISLEPRGPEAPIIYWLRRAAVLLVVITLIVGVWWVVAGRSSEPAAVDTTPVSESEALAVSEQVSETLEPIECPDESIRVRATTGKSTYSQGSKPKLTLVIRNIGDVPCTRDVGARANELKITSGGYHVWSSKHCNASKKGNVLTLEPGARAATSITWDGRLSKKGCPAKGAQAKPGSYELVGLNGDKSSKKSRFSITKSA
jgi:hypothetical protein